MHCSSALLCRSCPPLPPPLFPQTQTLITPARESGTAVVATPALAVCILPRTFHYSCMGLLQHLHLFSTYPQCLPLSTSLSRLPACALPSSYLPSILLLNPSLSLKDHHHQQQLQRAATSSYRRIVISSSIMPLLSSASSSSPPSPSPSPPPYSHHHHHRSFIISASASASSCSACIVSRLSEG